MTDAELNKAAEMLEVLKKDYLGMGDDMTQFEDVDQQLIDNEFLIEQEFDGMKVVDGFSEPMNDLDYSSPQP